MSIVINGHTYRIARDSITAAHIPVPGTDLAVGYINGRWPSYYDLPARFPNIPHVSIDVVGNRPDADVLDVESGDATPQTAVSWVRSKLARNEHPVLYVNRGNITAVFNAMHAVGFEVATHFKTWIATLDGTKAVADMTGVVAVQYLSNAGANYDESIVYDGSFKESPVPEPHPLIHGVLVMLPDGEIRDVTSADGGETWQ